MCLLGKAKGRHLCPSLGNFIFFSFNAAGSRVHGQQRCLQSSSNSYKILGQGFHLAKVLAQQLPDGQSLAVIPAVALGSKVKTFLESPGVRKEFKCTMAGKREQELLPLSTGDSTRFQGPGLTSTDQIDYRLLCTQSLHGWVSGNHIPPSQRFAKKDTVQMSRWSICHRSLASLAKELVPV